MVWTIQSYNLEYRTLIIVKRARGVGKLCLEFSNVNGEWFFFYIWDKYTVAYEILKIPQHYDFQNCLTII